MLVGSVPCLPGFIHNIDPSIGGKGVTYMFSISWLYGYISTASLYWLLSTIWPARETMLDSLIYDDLDQESIEGIGSADEANSAIGSGGFAEKGGMVTKSVGSL